MIMDKELLQRVHEDGVKFVSLQFSDVSGAVKSVDIPTGRLSAVLKDGIWFDGSSVEGFARIQESDMRLKPDLNTYAVLPWGDEQRRKARLFCDIYGIDGNPFPGDPRGVLRRVLEKVEELTLYTLAQQSEIEELQAELRQMKTEMSVDK